MNTPRILATFRLPIALSGLSAVQDMVERAYGTGDLRMETSGDNLHIFAPDDELGDIRHDPMPARAEREEAEMLLQYLDIREGRVKLTMEDTGNTVLLVAEMMRQWFGLMGGINYLETTLVNEREPVSEFVFTMQRRDGLTPADKAVEAENKLSKVREILTQYDMLGEMFDADHAEELRVALND